LAFLGGGFMVIADTSVKVNATYTLEPNWKNVVDTDGDQRTLYNTAELCTKQT
jgi:hypothetical protein